MKENFSGNIKDAIRMMIESGTDCCEITNTVGDYSVTLELTITKIVNGDEVIYEADNEEVCEFDVEEGEYLN